MGPVNHRRRFSLPPHFVSVVFASDIVFFHCSASESKSRTILSQSGQASRPTKLLDPTCAATRIRIKFLQMCLLVDRPMHGSSERCSQCFSQDPDLVINQFLAWLHLGPSGARAPAEVMLLKSKPHFVRCRELQSRVSRHQFQSAGHG